MTTLEALTGPRVVCEHEVLDGHAVLIRDDRIDGIVPQTQIPGDAGVRDLGPGLLSPGLVDVHTHGAAGASFNDGTDEANRQALSALLAGGVTTVLPTVATAPLEDMKQALAALRAVRGARDGLPRVPGAHLEGPYFAAAQCGAQDPAHLRAPDDGSPARLLDLADVIRVMSYAPELPGACDLTRRLVQAGIVAAAGHSDAREEDLLACQRLGLRHVIHVFSGQSGTVRQGPWRRPGLLEATLASEDLTVEMIGDGKHLPDTLMRLAHRCLAGRLCLVSDSTPGTGLADGGRYRMGGRAYVVEGGVGMTLDRRSFGGSITPLVAMIPTVMQALGIPLHEAVAMASAIPARAVGLGEQVGRIRAGAYADFVLLSHEFTVRAVAVAGRWQRFDDHSGEQPGHHPADHTHETSKE